MEARANTAWDKETSATNRAEEPLVNAQALPKNVLRTTNGGLRRFLNRVPEANNVAANSAASGPEVVAGAEAGVARFFRSFHVLLRSTRLYTKGHPRVVDALEATDRNLRTALRLVPSVAAAIESDQLVIPALGARSLPDSRGVLETLAGELSRSGVRSLVFLPDANLGELNIVANLLSGLQRIGPAGRQPQVALDWAGLLTRHGIVGIRINTPLDRKVDTVLASFMAALLAYGGSEPELNESSAAPAVEELMTTLRLLAQITPSLDPQQQDSPQDAARAIHTILEGADRRTINVLVAAMMRQTPREEEPYESYLARLADSLVLDFVAEEFHAGRVALPGIRGQLQRFARELGAACTNTGDSALRQRWTDDAFPERLYETFWTQRSAEQTIAALRSSDAWCVPVSSLRRHFGSDQTNGLPEGEARSLLLNYARCLESEKAAVRRAVAAALMELQPILLRLWPHQLPEELGRVALHALERETSPGIAALLTAVVENLARVALERRDYEEFERVLLTLEQAPRDADHAHMSALAARLVSDERWLLVVDAALSTRPLDPALPRLLRRDLERLLDRLGLLLTAPNGLDALPAMARLVRAIGQPVVEVLEARLYEQRRQRAATAVKLLVATHPDHLITALPRALPSWDWSVQDLAVSELARLGVPNASWAFLAVLTEAHPMVVPMMLDQIGLANEMAAVPLLLEIAAGENERLRDVFIRIKAIEALGRMRAGEAVDLLQAILNRRNGLAHVEPAGLRAAAEEALALIENHPSSARVRAAYEAVEKASFCFPRPRRYSRVALGSPFTAQIQGPQASEARVRTISLGGAFLESDRRLHVGDSLHVEIRAGLRHIRSTAVVRNVTPQGGGVEFVHMNHEDREKLRRLMRRLQRN